MTRAALALFLVLLPLGCAVGPSGAGPAPKTEGIILPQGGTVKVHGERIDLYDAQSHPIGYGFIRPDGGIDFFNLDGSARGTIRPSINGHSAPQDKM